MRVRYADCHPQAIVFNATYLLYFAVAFTELWRQAIGPWQQMTERGYDAVVAESRLVFRAPARFDDELDLEMTVEHLGTTSMRSRHRILRDGECLVEGSTVHVFVTVADGRKTPVPDWIRSALSPVPSRD